MRSSLALYLGILSLCSSYRVLAHPKDHSAKRSPADDIKEICALEPSACVEANAPAPPVGAIMVTFRKSPAPDRGSRSANGLVLPTRVLKARGELAFVTARGQSRSKPMALGDLALFRSSLRHGFGNLLDLSLGSSFSLKEPKGSNGWVWQGASVGAWLEALPSFASLVELKAGPLIDGRGSIWSNRVGFAGKWSLDPESRLLLSISELFTGLDGAGRLGAHAWLEELQIGVEAQLGRDPVAVWAAVDYAIPVAHGGDLPGAPRGTPMAPQTRLNLQLGGLLRMGTRREWEFSMYYTWIDRGELEIPGSMLPVIDGGFDQHQLVLGIARRFTVGSSTASRSSRAPHTHGNAE